MVCGLSNDSIAFGCSLSLQVEAGGMTGLQVQDCASCMLPGLTKHAQVTGLADRALLLATISAAAQTGQVLLCELRLHLQLSRARLAELAKATFLQPTLHSLHAYDPRERHGSSLLAPPSIHGELRVATSLLALVTSRACSQAMPSYRHPQTGSAGRHPVISVPE